jgi:hypothetical protein
MGFQQLVVGTVYNGVGIVGSDSAWLARSFISASALPLNEAYHSGSNPAGLLVLADLLASPPGQKSRPRDAASATPTVLVGIGSTNDQLSSFTCQLSGCLPNGSVISLDKGSSPDDLAASYVNGNATTEMLVLNSGTSKITAYTNGSGGLAAYPLTISIQAGARALAVIPGAPPALAVLRADTAGKGSVDIFQSTGTNTFALLQSVAVGADPRTILSADFNADGRSDLAVSNFADNTVSILLRDATGKFSAAAAFPTGAGPVGIAAADWNGDSKMDLVVTNFTAGTVSLLAGDGLGKFAAPANTATGAGPSRVIAVDYDSDGKTDIVVSNTTDQTIAFLQGDGKGKFAAPVPYATGGTSPVSLLTTDVDGDSRPDFIVANRDSGDFAVFLNRIPPAGTPNITSVNTLYSGASLTQNA